MLRDRLTFLDYIKSLILMLFQLVNKGIGLTVAGLYVLSMDRMLSSMTPKWLLPWWGVLFVVFQFGLMYFFRYSEKRWMLMGIFFLISIINYVIAYNYNPMTPTG